MAEQEQTVDQQQEKAREKAEDDRYQRAEQQQAAYDAICKIKKSGK